MSPRVLLLACMIMECTAVVGLALLRRHCQEEQDLRLLVNKRSSSLRLSRRPGLLLLLTKRDHWGISSVHCCAIRTGSGQIYSTGWSNNDNIQGALAGEGWEVGNWRDYHIWGAP